MAAENTNTNPSAPASLHDRVKAVLDKIRPVIQMDGGDIQLVKVDETGLVTVQLHGACVGCPGAKMTLKMGVERHLREKVPEVREVVAI